MTFHFARRRAIRAVCLLSLVGVLVAACAGPTSTPEIIRNPSRLATQTALAGPSATPSGPTPTATQTSTPYIRPTDPAEIDPERVIARVGSDEIRLGAYRARVRYERFAALEDARRLIEAVGLVNVNFGTPIPNAAADSLSAVFNTLANSSNFGYQIYDVMLRESVIRQEFARRGLTVTEKDIQGYWIRRFNLQLAADPAEALRPVLAAYMEEAGRYSGLSPDQINEIAAAYVRATALLPIIGRENSQPPPVLSFKIKWLRTADEATAQTALAALNSGATFREVACQYSALLPDRATLGEIGFQNRADLGMLGANADSVLRAEVGAIVGPLKTPLGWAIYRVLEKRRNADGEPEARLQQIVVATEALAKDITTRADAEGFGALACRYSLDPSGGNGGDYGFVGVNTLPAPLANAVQAKSENGIVGPIRTDGGYDVVVIEDRKMNIPQPGDIERAIQRAYVNWQTAQVDALVRAQDDIWKQVIPTDPIPVQVAPYMREENFGLPTLAPSETPRP